MAGCNKDCADILNVKNQFLCGFDLKLIRFDDLVDHVKKLKVEDQENHIKTILDGTVFNPLIKERPLRVSYRKQFLKILLELFEKIECDCSSLYESYVEVLQINDYSSYHYKHYCFDDQIISLRETINVISQGTTGLSAWQAGIALSDWCLNNKSVFYDQCVLELGCGVGFTGLVVCLSGCKPRSYLFTDCHPNVLQSLSFNLEINNVQDRCQDIDIAVSKLDWLDFHASSLNYRPTIILGADIVYDPETFPSLFKTLDCFLTSDAESMALIACTLRDDSTVNTFKDGLCKNNLIVINSTPIMSNTFYFASDPTVILFKIKSSLAIN